MSEFRIIKCRKCDAALVEIEGEKLTHCIQCGYKFGGIEKQPSSKFHARLDRLRRTKESKASKKPRTSRTTRSKESSKKPLSNKKKAPVWLTIIKWYIIISVTIGIITGLFR